MSGEQELLKQLHNERKCCASILVQMGLWLAAEENPTLVKALSGLCEGLHSGYVCGALSGGCCMLALFADDKQETAELSQGLVAWFESEYGKRCGGIDCSDITKNDPTVKREYCSALINATYSQAKQILREYGKIA